MTNKGGGMLLQLHWQFEDGRTEFCSQRNVGNYSEIRVFVEDAKKSHPLPPDAAWMMCTEHSEYFVKTKKGEAKK